MTNTNPNDNSDSQKMKKTGNGKFHLSVLQLSILIGIAALIVVYLGVAIYFKNHFLFGSEVNNVNVAGKTVDEANDMISTSTDNYKLTINGRNDKTETITAKDINLKYVKDNKINEFKNNQNSLAWIVSIFTKDSTETTETMSYDDEALKKTFDSLSILSPENMVEPISATIVKENGNFVIKPEDLGSKIDKDKLYEAIKDAINSGKESISIEEADCYVAPELTQTSDKIVNTMDQINKFSNVTISYNIHSNSETLNGDTIKKWLTIDDKLNINIDDDSATEYVQNLAYKYDTSGKSRNFKTTKRGNIQVDGGSYGWKIDVQAETNELFKVIRAGESTTREPIYLVNPGANDDIGNSYVEIDITNQHLYLYINGNMIHETDIVSGDESGLIPGAATPNGTYYIYYKEKDSVLRGEGYNTDVAYWMPFNGGIGLHDATWRYGVFGEDIYKNAEKRGGSHGCVNLPLETAKICFENVYAGMPVVVYR